MWVSVARDSWSYILIEEGFFVLSFVEGGKGTLWFYIVIYLSLSKKKKFLVFKIQKNQILI